jgi:hypothetical protein
VTRASKLASNDIKVVEKVLYLWGIIAVRMVEIIVSEIEMN